MARARLIASSLASPALLLSFGAAVFAWSPADSGAPVIPAAQAPASGVAAAPVVTARDPRWALRLERPGLRNFHAVSAMLYRGAQPSREGLVELRRLGVKTVVSLRAFHGERQQVAAAGLAYERISFATWHPEDSDLRRFVVIATDPERQPVFVHCKRGADRTGTAVAVYRICVEGWQPEAAIEEMVNGGYAFEKRFTHLKRFLRGLDLAACRGEWQRR